MVNKYWFSKEEMRCDLCGKEEDSIDHWRENCRMIERTR